MSVIERCPNCGHNLSDSVRSPRGEADPVPASRVASRAKGRGLPTPDPLRGAVKALREIARLLDRSTQTGKAPTQDEWAALTLANATLARVGGQ